MNIRLRSANRTNANNAWNVNTAGYLNNNNANNSYRAQPDCAAELRQKTFAQRGKTRRR